MPYLNVKLKAPDSRELKEKVAATLTELTAIVLGKKKELTVVSIECIEAGSWFIGGKALDKTSENSFYLDVKVTEGTNTKNEKAEYMRQVFHSMEAIIGNVAPASYIAIHEVRADAWGYQGQSQEFRYINGRSL